MKRAVTITQMKKRQFKYIDDIPERLKASVGQLASPFVMLIWGQSGHGKSNFVMQLAAGLGNVGNMLYLSLEEGIEAPFVSKVNQHLAGADVKIKFVDASIKLDGLIKLLDKRRSAKLIIVDSLQYFGISYVDYKHLKERYPTKSWIYISHAKGNYPDGKTADKIRYDAGVKIQVQGKVAFPASRYGGNKPYVIWEEGAKAHWGRKFKSVINGTTK